jgi:hypothetical protein
MTLMGLRQPDDFDAWLLATCPEGRQDLLDAGTTYDVMRVWLLDVPGYEPDEAPPAEAVLDGGE